MQSRSDSTPPRYDQPSVLKPIAQPPVPASSGPLTVEHMQQLAAADIRAKKLRNAGRVAMFNGVIITIFSGLSLLLVLGGLAFGEYDWLGFVMTIGLGAIAWNEFRGRTLLMQLEPRAPRVLGWNQLTLLGLIVAYAAFMLIKTMVAGDPELAKLGREPGVSDMIGDFRALEKLIAELLYGSLIVGTLVFQGLNALYYFTRAKLLRAYLAETPAWVVDLQRCQAGGAVASR